MTWRDRLHRTATSTRDLVAHAGAERWELYVKASTVHETITDRVAPTASLTVEETGVAVRTWGRGRAGFAAASGLDVDASRRAVEGAVAAAMPLAFDPLPPARLLAASDGGAPRPEPDPAWWRQAVADIGRAVTARSGGRLELRRVVIQRAGFAWLLTTGEGFVVAHEGSSSSLLSEVTADDRGRGVWREALILPTPDRFDPVAAAAQVCDRALLATGPVRGGSGLADVILHSEVSAHLVAALVPLLVARPPATDPLPGLLDRSGQLTAPVLTLVDDRAGGDVPVPSPCDGEGLAAPRLTLVDQGVPRHRLASYRDAILWGEAPRGGAVRRSYRDYPGSGISNLRVAVDHGVAPSQLLERAPRSLYLLRPLAPVRLHPADDDYRILASGVWLENGRISGWQPVVELNGAIGQLLRRIECVATDLAWYQTEHGLVGAPSLLLRRQRVVG
jgi:predicted Zn-dependent protease